MNAPSYDIKDMLEADVTVDTTNFPIERGTLNESLANSTAIIDVPGGPPQLTMDVKKYEFLSVQIKVKSADYDAGWAVANAIKDSLHGRAHETWNGAYYSVITCLNGPGFMEREKQRPIFVINFSIQRR